MSRSSNNREQEVEYRRGRKRRQARSGTVVLTSLMIAPLLLTSCGSRSGSSGEAPQTGARPEAPKPPEPVELVFKDATFGWSAESFMKDYGNAIQNKYPHMKITFVPKSAAPIKEMLTTKAQLDVVIVALSGFYGNIEDNKLQFDMTPYIKKHGFDMERIDPTTVALAKQLAGGGIYGMPVNGAASPIVYNKDLFDKFGVAYPTDKMTWDDLYEMTKKLSRSEGGVSYYGAVISPADALLRNSFSLGFINPTTQKADFSSSKWRDYVHNLLRFYQIPGNQLSPAQLAGGETRTLFHKEQRLAMWLPVSGTGVHDLSFEGINYDFAKIPSFKEAPGIGPQSWPLFFYLTSTSAHKEEAFQALAFLASDEFQMQKSRSGILTVLRNKEIRQAFAQDAPEYKGKNLQAFLPESFAPPAYMSKYNGYGVAELNKAFTELMAGGKDYNTAIREAEERTNQKIAELESANK
ncbi:extracellular solute-binding protein [Paenibacillus sp. GYB004]|uniref:ABC transporter substrate-binding protein n=1 Tax=Paenibacillus sp. GYB004 TaxID=2994393 RepID=UPI002F96DC9E